MCSGLSYGHLFDESHFVIHSTLGALFTHLVLAVDLSTFKHSLTRTKVIREKVESLGCI